MDADLLNDPDACYAALRARDTRFDGRFFVGVTSTGIYCRPVCAVRCPQQQNCRFFSMAAQAEEAGFRPCLRCRPELAPGNRHWSMQDAGQLLLGQALLWLDHPSHWQTNESGQHPMEQLTRRLGVTDRHLRRLFQQSLGVSPQRYIQTRRLLNAKQMLTDTELPMAQVALSSGFGSLRRFNAVFLAQYGLSPSALRRHRPSGSGSAPMQPVARLTWRPPLHVDALMDFLRQRQLPGNELLLDGPNPGIAKAVHVSTPAGEVTGWLELRLRQDKRHVALSVSPSLVPQLPQVIWRVRHWLDLDTDTTTIDNALLGDFPGTAGMRAPGSFDGFETAVRAILGQQVSLTAANAIAAKLSQALGDVIETPWPTVNRTFPTPSQILAAAPEQLGQLGVIRQRQHAIRAMAEVWVQGKLCLEPSLDLTSTLAQLQALPGIGPWTAQYIAMRVLRWPDAWPPNDAAVRRVLKPIAPNAETLDAWCQHANHWRPWRSYALVRAWASPAMSAPSNPSP